VQPVKVTRFYTAEDGRSRFEDLEVPMQSARAGRRSDPVPSTGFLFRESDGTDDYLELHVAPRRQIILCLAGEVEIELGDGSKRLFGPGDAYLADDLTGEGHSHREISGPVKHAWVFLPEDFDLDAWRTGR
jgi:hypothetical protein